MTDTVKLRKAIAAKGIKLGFVAEAVGLSCYGLQRKINNKSEFKAGEIAALSELLDLTTEERDEIFFARKRDE